MRLDFIVGAIIIVGFIYIFPISSFMGIGASISDMASMCLSSGTQGSFSSQIIGGFTCKYLPWYYIGLGVAALCFIYGLIGKK
jgi:hypothetical protein